MKTEETMMENKGAEKSVEERILRLEEKAKQSEARIAIADLMGRYAFYCGADLKEKILTDLWTKSDEASLEYGASGVYKERWKVETFYNKKAVPGKMTTLSFSTPLLEVSQGGERARGLWMAFSTETDAGDLGIAPPDRADGRRALLSSITPDGRRYRAEILLQKYDVDFVLEDGAWKILHLHVSEYFRCPYDKDWVRYAGERLMTDGMWLESLFESSKPLPPQSHGENLPSGPSTEHWQYGPDRVPEPVPKKLPE